MKELREENSFVLFSDGATETRFHNSKLCYQVTDLVKSSHQIGVDANGIPQYGGFPEIETAYKGEVLHGIVLRANLRSFDITIKGYPKTAVRHFQVPIFAMAFGGVVMLNKARTDLSEYARQRAVRLLHSLYHGYHHPVTGAFLDITDALGKKYLALRAECLRDPCWQPAAQDNLLTKQLSERKAELKKQLKAGGLKQSEYQKALKEVQAQKEELEIRRFKREQQLRFHLVEQCRHFISETYDVPLEQCDGLLTQLTVE